MGFLDHSTNSIIVDAVLTDAGRKLIADPNASFTPSFFSLGDDEVDYGIIQQFGRNVGKEKIEKNTPVLEAFTQSNLAQKYKLATTSNETLTHLPVLTADATNNLITFKRSSSSNRESIAFTIQNTQSDIQIPFAIADRNILVEIDSRFFDLLGASTLMSVDKNNIAKYLIGTSRETGSKITSSLTISLKSISNKDFSRFSIPSGQYIRSFVKITGQKSGAQKIIELRIE